MNYAIAYSLYTGGRAFVEGDSILECVTQIGCIQMEDKGNGNAELSFKMEGYSTMVGRIQYAMSEESDSSKFSTHEARDDFARTFVCERLIEHHHGVVYKNKNNSDLYATGDK